MPASSNSPSKTSSTLQRDTLKGKVGKWLRPIARKLHHRAFESHRDSLAMVGANKPDGDFKRRHSSFTSHQLAIPPTTLLFGDTDVDTSEPTHCESNNGGSTKASHRKDRKFGGFVLNNRYRSENHRDSQLMRSEDGSSEDNFVPRKRHPIFRSKIP